jgi:hypothetical protein
MLAERIVGQRINTVANPAISARNRQGSRDHDLRPGCCATQPQIKLDRSLWQQSTAACA